MSPAPALSLSARDTCAQFNHGCTNGCQRQNRLWQPDLRSAGKMSPRVLTDFLALTDPQVYEFFKTLAPDALADISVSWAGNQISPITDRCAAVPAGDSVSDVNAADR